MRKWLCKIGFHKWKYLVVDVVIRKDQYRINIERGCFHCGLMQKTALLGNHHYNKLKWKEI